MNITQKLYSKTHLNDVLAIMFFSYVAYFVTSHKIVSSYISTSSLSYAQRFFSKMKLVKTSLRTPLKQTNLENIPGLHISAEQPKVLMILFFKIVGMN